MKNSFPALIVEDEASARKSLTLIIEKYCPEIEILDQAQNIMEARKLIINLNPKIVFLDIEMPGGNAFDLLEEFVKIPFEVIFITAFSEYAVQAFEFSASHYLLKPVSIDALMEAVKKAVFNISQKTELEHNRILLDNLNSTQSQSQKIVLPLLDGFELVRLSDIMYISALDNFSQVHLKEKRKITVCRKLKYFEDLLKSCFFSRIHRSHIVNRAFISRYHKGKGGYVTLLDGKELMVSQSRKNTFLEGFGLI